MKLLKYFAFITAFFPLSVVNAQNDFIHDEIAALREDVKILQRQVYRSSKGADDTPSAVVTPSAESGTDIKMLGEYDQIIRNLNGKIDEIEHKISELEKRIETVNKDIDVRLKLIEGKPIQGIGTSAANTKKYDAPVAKNAPKFVTGGAVYGEELKPLRTSDALVQDIYNTGLDALHEGNFEVATQNFSTVIEQYPNDRLAGNAYYWLGEVYYKQQDYKSAAVTFANGYQKYKDNPKAADNLFKLGMSMKGLNKKDEACGAFTNLAAEFPSASQELKTKANDEAKKLGCK